MSSEKHEALQPLHPSMEGKLDPAFVKLYNDNVATKPPKPINLEQLRKGYSVLYSYGTAPAPEVGRVYDDVIPLADGTQLPVRVYEPERPGPWPVHVDFHGGGWGLGDLDSESHICRHYCKKANVAVIDVAYRLVPESPFPTGITDSFAAVQHIREHGAARFNVLPDSISVGGVSAGGAIALAVAHLARDAGIPLRLVAVCAPVIDDLSQYASAADSPFPSMQENEFAPTLNWARLTWFDKLKRSSVPDEPAAKERVGWFLNLLKAPNFKGLPPTVVYTASADPLRDEGERYAQLLIENGVEVTQRRFFGVPHPFMHMDAVLPQARECIDTTARHIRLAHYDSTGTLCCANSGISRGPAPIPESEGWSRPGSLLLLLRQTGSSSSPPDPRPPSSRQALLLSYLMTNGIIDSTTELIIHGSNSPALSSCSSSSSSGGASHYSLDHHFGVLPPVSPSSGNDFELELAAERSAWDHQGSSPAGWHDAITPISYNSPQSDSHESLIVSPMSSSSSLSTYNPPLLPQLTSSNDRALLNHYMTIVSSLLSRRMSPNNPYNAYLLPIARDNDLVMHCILALSANHWRKLQPQLADRGLYHQSKATQSLARLLPHVDRSNADIALVSSLLLCMTELFDGTSEGWQLHLKGAKRLLTALMNQQQGDRMNGHNKFLVRLARFLDSAATTSTCKPPLMGEDEREAATLDRLTAAPDDEDSAIYGIPKELFHLVDVVNSLA
ncbi:alpha/beta-hydrolase, partial [Trichoderma citrinoviride]